MNRIDRLTAMILMLQSHRVVTAEQISEHFEISVRTVYRDIAALGEAGVPIVAEAGVGYSLMHGYNLPPVMFTEAEAAALFMSGQLAEQFGDESLKKSLSGALLKVRSALPESHKSYLQQLNRTVHVSRNNQNFHDETSLMPVQEAVVRRRCMRIQYDTGSRGEITERVIEPLGIIFYGKQWHVIAWCRKREALRDFRIDRMLSWEILNEVYSGHEEFSLADFLEHELSPENLTPVTLQCHRWVFDRVTLEMPCRIESHTELSIGVYEIKGQAYSLKWLAHWLISLGTCIKVVKPDELRRHVKEEAERIVEIYT